MSLTGIFKDTGGISFRLVSGVLRNTDGTGFKVLADATHQPVNMGSVQTVNKTVVLSFPNNFKVVGFTATPDETYSSMGITMGASVVTNAATIWFSQFNHTTGTFQRIDPKTVVTEYGNIWILGFLLA